MIRWVLGAAVGVVLLLLLLITVNVTLAPGSVDSSARSDFVARAASPETAQPVAAPEFERNVAPPSQVGILPSSSVGETRTEMETATERAEAVLKRHAENRIAVAEAIQTACFEYEFHHLTREAPGSLPDVMSPHSAEVTKGDSEIEMMEVHGSVTLLYDGKALFIEKKVHRVDGYKTDGTVKDATHREVPIMRYWISNDQTALQETSSIDGRLGILLHKVPASDVRDQSVLYLTVPFELWHKLGFQDLVYKGLDPDEKCEVFEDPQTGDLTIRKTWFNEDGIAISRMSERYDSTGLFPSESIVEVNVQLSGNWAPQFELSVDVRLANGIPYTAEFVSEGYRFLADGQRLPSKTFRLRATSVPRINEGGVRIPPIPSAVYYTDMTISPPRTVSSMK